MDVEDHMTMGTWFVGSTVYAADQTDADQTADRSAVDAAALPQVREHPYHRHREIREPADDLPTLRGLRLHDRCR